MKAAKIWTAPVTYGSGTMKSVKIADLSGRIELVGHTVYVKPSGSAGRGVKGKYLLRWEVLDRWTPSPTTGRSWTEVEVIPGKTWTFDRKIAMKVAERHLAQSPLPGPLPGSWTAKKVQP